MCVVLAVGAAVGCSYDWATGAPADAGDASVDAGDATAPDAADASPDHADVSTADCTTLLAKIPAARAAAKVCTLPSSMECTAEVVDECGCRQVVGQSGATGTYRAAVADYVNAGCPKPVACPVCATTVQHGLCVAADGGGTACIQ